MNDRFRFRAWNKPKKKFVLNAEHYQDGLEQYFFYEPSNFGDLLLDDDFIMEQYTGLKDKNGKLIYEGDIVKYTRTNWYCPGHHKHNQDLIEINEIFWDEEEYSFRRRGKFPGGNGSGWIGSIKFNDSRADENIIEVIGNIHENSELLED